MKLRIYLSILAAAAPLLLAADAAAQTGSPAATAPQKAGARPIPSPPKHGGTFHVATGTWTRHAGSQAAALGPSVIYSNTAPSGYFSDFGASGGTAPGSENFDEGSLPGPFNSGPFPSVPVTDIYFINCVSIGYCDLGAPGTSGFRLQFFSEYTPCTLDTVPDATVVATGLPAAGGCWTIDLDLSGGTEFCLQAEGEGVFDDDINLDSFGWSFTYAGMPGNNAGFMMAGNPDATDPGFSTTGAMTASNTYFGATQCAGLGTGYLTRDFWWVEDPSGVNSNCFFFGGYANNGAGCAGPVTPYASFHLELAGDLTQTCALCISCGNVYCNSNPNSTGINSELVLTGSDLVANDDATLVATVPQDVFGFFVTSQTQGFVANPAGSEGNLCLGGMIGRFVAPGQIKNSGTQGEISLSTTAGEWSLLAIPGAMGSFPALPGSSTNFQLWHRDVGPTSNFTDAISITWQ